MKTKMLLVFPIVMASLFLTFSCREPEKETYYMPQEFKDYVMFPVGSYWVYEDSASGAVDSIYLKSSETSIYEPPHTGYNFENLKQTFYSSRINSPTISRIEYYDDVFEYFGIGYFFDISDGRISCSNGKLISIEDTVLIYNTIYYDIAQFQQMDLYNKYSFCWTKKIGLVKKTDATGTWLLKKYFINN